MDISVVLILLGLAIAGCGVWGFVRNGRRLSHGVLILAGLGTAAVGALAAFYREGHEQPLLVVAAGVAVVALVTYFLLAIFLVVNGIIVLTRERFTLGNSLALVAGLAMCAGPWLLSRIPIPTSGPAWRSVLGTSVLLAALLVAAYVGLCLAVFLLSTVLYQRLPRKVRPAAVIVLGAGLIGGKVPPLLAARLDRGAVAATKWDVPMITSGGQGPDEPVPEGEAMRDYLLAQGIPANRILVEDRSRTTRENLVLSRDLLPDPKAPVVVVTSAYHSFRAAMLTRSVGLNARVVGARTAGYYVPSALLREFIAIMREHLVLNAICLGLILLMVLGLGAAALGVGFPGPF